VGSRFGRVRGFRDRAEAGEALAATLADADLDDPLVLALPRGGIQVAAPVARRLDAPLDLLLVRKIGVPWHPELAMGAIAEGGYVVRDERVVSEAGVGSAEFERVVAREQQEIVRRAALYRDGREPPDLAGRTVVIVDDGLATGSTARVAVQAARAGGAATVVVAVPVGSPQAVKLLEALADEVVCLLAPFGFSAVGAWYEDFRQVSDDEVRETLAEARSG
jgi:putative phosphoribosyl transferase